jgi:hypothetical protein
MLSKLIKITLTLLGLQVLAGCASSGSVDFFSQSEKKDYSNMYLRGVFNWWEVNESFKLAPTGSDQYSVTIELIADGQPYDFKVADNVWTMTLNCGNEYGEQEAMTLGENVTLICASDSVNLQFTPSETGLFVFTLDTSDNEEPELTIERME